MATRRIDTTLGLSGEKEFNDQMKSVNNELKNLSAEMKVAATASDEESSAIEKLANKQRILNAQVDQQEEKVRALADMHKRAAEAAGEDSAAADKYRQQLLNAQAALNKMKAEQSAVSEELEEARKPLTRIKGALDEAKEKLSAFGDKFSGVAKVLKGAGSLIGGAAEGALKLTAGLTAAGAAATGALSTLAVTGVKQLTDMAVEAAQNGDPAFEGLAANLESLSGASSAAKAALGSVLLPALESLSGEGAQWLNDFSAAMAETGGDTEAMGRVMSDYIKSGVDIIRRQLPQFLALGKDLLGGLGDGIIENLPEILSMTEEIIVTLLDGLEENSDDLGDAAVTIVNSLATFLLNKSPDLLTAGITLFTTVLTGLSSSLPELIPVATDAVLALLEALITNAPLLLSSGLELILGIVSGLAEALPQLAAQAPVIVQELGDAIMEGAERIKDIGSKIVDKIWEGLRETWDRVKQWFRGAAGDLGEEMDSATGGSYTGAATGINYVPSDNYLVNLHEGEMVLPKRLASQLRAAGVNKNSNLDSLGGGSVVNTTVYTAQLSQSQVDYLVDQINRKLGEAM